MRQIMDRVKKYIADTQEEKRHVAYVHCHADQIKLGNYTQLLFVCYISYGVRSGLKFLANKSVTNLLKC
jgi:predicted RNase H-related nuclease YkuK (DUF458 family)